MKVYIDVNNFFRSAAVFKWNEKNYISGGRDRNAYKYLPYDIIKDYLENNKNASINEIKEQFNSRFPTPTIRDENEYNKYVGIPSIKSRKDRVFEEAIEYNGKKLFITNQWSSDSSNNSIPKFIEIANKLGYQIETQNVHSKTYWLISSNPSEFDALGAFRKLSEVDWGNAANNHIKIDDVVFIYISKPLQKIAIKTIVTKSDFDETELLGNDGQFNNSSELRTREKYFRLKFIKFIDNDLLSLDRLQENGLNGNIQGKRKIEGELLDYILKNEKEQNYKDEFSAWWYGDNSLQNNGSVYAQGTKDSYFRELNRLTDGVLNGEDIFTVDNIAKLNELFNRLNNGDLVEYNKRLQNTDPSNGLKQYIKFHESRVENKDTLIEKKDANLSLNTILYGPPGTGKTYNTINKALEILNPEFYADNKNDRKALVSKFEKYKNSKQIEFITFHQSYGYEEFVEGIKAEVTDNGLVKYIVEDGIFKRFSKLSLFMLEFTNFIDKVIGTKIYGNIIINNIDNTTIDVDNTGFGDSVTLEIEKFVIVHNSFSDYYNKASKKMPTRKREKLYFFNEYSKDILKDSKHVLWLYVTILNVFYERLKSVEYTANTKKYVLIIDEINRGNISKIFGELITLVETSKRYGNKEAIEIALPYSSEIFSVPKNLYIVGTMNTADRSIALMDTALRRRFNFEEMMPKYELESISTNLENSGINLQEILKVINKRVEYLYDRDHTIGHAYFIDINTFIELDDVMKNKIIPLLQEYFYDDWEKIQIVLGDHEKQLKKLEIELSDMNSYRFIQSEKLLEKDVLGFSHEDIEETQVGYEISENFTPEMYEKICK